MEHKLTLTVIAFVAFLEALVIGAYRSAKSIVLGITGAISHWPCTFRDHIREVLWQIGDPVHDTE